LDIFIERLGFESILSEKGDIAYSFDIPLDESCYREVENVDIFVLIVGGRYGSEVSNGEKKPDKRFYDRYESITKKEYETAVKKDVPVYILIESNVYAEYRTFLKNKENDKINFAHVDSVNIFYFIEDILSKPRNNPIQTFDKFDEIENWLKEQWAGLFRELLNRKSQQNQIRTLTTEVGELQEINKTLKTYLEVVLKTVKPESDQLIATEEKRLSDATIRKDLEKNPWFDHLLHFYKIKFPEAIKLFTKAKSYDDFISLLPNKENQHDARKILLEYEDARKDFNEARRLLGLTQFKNLPSKK
jgi:RNA processing factor Prp31